MGIIEVGAVPATLSLTNASENTVYYSSIVPIKATLVVIEDNVDNGGSTGPTGDTGPMGDFSTISFVPTASRYFYFPSTNLDLSSTVTIPAGDFSDDNENTITEFNGLRTNSFNNLFINGIMQPGIAYSLSNTSLIIPASSGTIFAGTPIIIEIIEINIQL